MSQPTKKFYPSGKVERERYEVDGLPHRADGPAVVYYYEDGKLDSEYWYLNGKLHREDGPAIVHHMPDGTTLHGSWYQHGRPLALPELEDKPKRKKSG